MNTIVYGKKVVRKDKFNLNYLFLLLDIYPYRVYYYVGENMERNEKIKSNSLKRLNRINGQINGIKKMLENDRQCEDILIQISAVTNALKSLGQEILLDHMQICMTKDIQNNKLETVNEVVDLCRRLM